MPRPILPDEPHEPVGVRIGELSRRVGVSTELLRAWERRYRLLQPARSTTGYRLYAAADEQRVRAMQEQLAQGLSAAEAARAARRELGEAVGSTDTGSDRSSGADTVLDLPVLATVSGIPASAPAGATGSALDHHRALERALDAYDEAAAQHVFDVMFRELAPLTVLRDIVTPFLVSLGHRWNDGLIDLAQEHFANNVIRGRLGNLALGWGDGVGPRAVLACPQGELNDLPLMIFGLALHRSGWRIIFLGNNIPVTDLENAVPQLRPDTVVLAATTPTPFLYAGEELRRLSHVVPVVIAGPGATAEVAAATGITALTGDPVTEAQRLPVPSRTATVTR